MYTRKPKDMTKFLVGINAAQALHTWQYADSIRLAQMGSTASLSMRARKKREANRKVIGQYRDSKIATIATTMRGDVHKFTQQEQVKREKRFDKAAHENKTAPRPLHQPKPRPASDASLYHRPLI